MCCERSDHKKALAELQGLKEAHEKAQAEVDRVEEMSISLKRQLEEREGFVPQSQKRDQARNAAEGLDDDQNLQDYITSLQRNLEETRSSGGRPAVLPAALRNKFTDAVRAQGRPLVEIGFAAKEEDAIILVSPVPPHAFYPPQLTARV